MFLGYQQGKIKFYTKEKLDLALYNLDKVEETQDEYVLDNGEYVLKDVEWEQAKARLEREKIDNLTCTKRVFALGLQQLGISYLQLKEIISSDEQAQMEWDLCERLVRKNPLINNLAEKFRFDKNRIDEIFIKANM